MSHVDEQRCEQLDRLLERAPVVPVLAIARLQDAVPLARALVEGGLPILEVTLRTACALEAIALIRDQVPDACVGAGTVLSPADLASVAEAGAAFAISPGATEALYEAAANSPVPLLPGVASASDIMRGLGHGYRRFKLFPAESSGGVAALKAFAGPFPQVRFCPTGGIDAARAPAYLGLPNVITVGGSWMVPADAIAGGDWARIRTLAGEAAALRVR